MSEQEQLRKASRASAPHAKSTQVTRRQFQRTALGAAIAAMAAPAVVRGRNLNEKLDVAIIGVGGAGGFKMDYVAQTENIVALCDVSQAILDGARAKYPQARVYHDFRAFYDKDTGFDAVIVSTPEHTHAFATLPALRMGKHVFCEKPLAHNVWETRLVREVAAEANLATQMGTQIHAGENYRQVVELIRAGAIGPVSEAHVWVGRAWGWQSPADAARFGDIVSVQDRPEGSSPVPPGFDWALWLGPALDRPFHDVYVPGPKWYRWWDFGSGTMSDLGSHWNDLPFWALDLQAPTTIEAFGPPPHAEIAPASMRAVYEYAARGDMPPVRLTWHQGQEKPEIWHAGGIPQWDSGVLFIGTEGRMLLADYDKHVLLPEAAFAGFKRPAPTIPRSIGHYDEWVHACKTGAPTTCNFEYAGWLTEANHLGNVAYRCGKKLEWDPTQLRAVNAPEADRYLRREYRAGWELA
jgi:predicted dehydrogenase